MTILRAAGLMLCVCALVATQSAVRAENPDHVKQLKDTKKCPACDLSKAKLNGLDLEGADLSGANLSEAQFYGANLRNANLAGANLYGAYLKMADMAGATDADLSAAVTDERTTCPNGKRGPCQ